AVQGLPSRRVVEVPAQGRQDEVVEDLLAADGLADAVARPVGPYRAFPPGLARRGRVPPPLREEPVHQGGVGTCVVGGEGTRRGRVGSSFSHRPSQWAASFRAWSVWPTATR